MARQAQASAQDKTYFITGSTDGIGKHTAQALARLTGSTVLVHGRNAEKAQKAADEIKQSTGNQQVEAFGGDLSSLAQTRKLAEAVQEAHPSIDVLINNAGVFATRRQTTEDGFELTWAVNVLAPFLLTTLLYKNIKERIVNVSSISAGSSIDFENLQAEKRFSDHGSYSLSKIAMQAFTKELADRKPNSQGPTINCLDPGTVNTKMLDLGWGPCGMNVKEANYEFYLATDPAVANSHGEYFVSNRPYRMSRQVYEGEVRKRLWGIFEEQTGQKFA